MERYHYPGTFPPQRLWGHCKNRNLEILGACIKEGQAEYAEHRATETREPLAEKTDIRLVGLKHSGEESAAGTGQEGEAVWQPPMSLHHGCLCPCESTYRCGYLREGTMWGQGAFTPEAGTNSCQSDSTCLHRPRPPIHSLPWHLGMLAALHCSVLGKAFRDAPFSLSLVCPS